MCIREKHLFHNDIFLHLKFVLSNERLDKKKKKKSKRINNADSFSQPSLIIFAKGADIFGRVCVCVCVCVYIYIIPQKTVLLSKIIIFFNFLFLVFWRDLYLALYHPCGRCH